MSVKERHRRERRARSQAILDAAATVFADHGLEGATVEMVARQAEVAVGTIYLYFCSRDDLFLNLIAERLTRLRAEYLEIKARKLDPMSELRAIAGAYVEFLGESRGLFLTQLSVEFSKLGERLRRRAERDSHRRVMALMREIFDLWESVVGRVCDAGLIAGGRGRTHTAVVLWASLNGAFLLTGDDRLFRELTGLSAENFVTEALDFHLGVAAAAVANGQPKTVKHGSSSVARRGRLKKQELGEETAASTVV